METGKPCCGTRRRVFGWFCGISAASLLAVAAFLVVVLVYKPQELQISVSEASLAQFALAAGDSHTLSYSLTLAVAVRNPNRKGGVFFGRVTVAAAYKGNAFAAANLTAAAPFYQGRKNTTVLRTVLRGKHAPVIVEGRDLEQYGSETSSGFYVIDVEIGVRVRVRQSGVLGRYFEPPEIECHGLRVPLRSESDGGSAKFRVTKCKNVFIFKTRGDQRVGDSDHY